MFVLLEMFVLETIVWRRGGSGGEKGTDKEEGTDEEEGADEEEEDGGVMPLSLAFSLSHSSALPLQ